MKNFAQSWLEIQCQSIDGLCAGLFLLADTGKTDLKLVARWPSDGNEALELMAVSRLALKNGDNVINLDVTGRGAEKREFDYLALPVYLKKKLLGVVAVKTVHHDEETRQKIFQTLMDGSKWLGMLQFADEKDEVFYLAVVELAVNCLQQDSVEKAFTVLLGDLSRKFNCERIAVGHVKNHHADVIALSNSASFDDKSNLIRSISLAMDEAIDQDQVIVYPETGEDSLCISYAHAELARKFGCEAICSIPFAFDGEIFAVLTMERSGDVAFEQKTVDICEQTLALLSPFLKLKQDEELFWLHKLGLSLKRGLTNLFGFNHLRFKLLILMMASVIAFASVSEGEFRIHAGSVLEGRIQRTIAAPMEGFIKSANVRAGDTVLQGEVMAIMEDTELVLETNRLAGEREQLQREYREAMSGRELVKVSVLNAQLLQIDAKIELKKEALQRTRIKAPFAGIVIEGDLSQSLGAPVNLGDSLFKIAPLDGYRVILKVDERFISHIRHGQAGVLSLSSLPDRKFPLQIKKITRVATADDGSNVFRVEAALTDTPKLLRPGMEGIARVHIGQRKLLWIWTHELVDWFKLWVWSWWP